MKNILVILTAIAMFSCSETSRLAKNTVLYNFPTGIGPNTVNKYTITNKPEVQVEERSGHLVIQFTDSNDEPSVGTPITIISPTGFTASMAISNEFYFYESQDKGAPKTLSYTSQKFQLQAISIPFKFRASIKNNPRVLDSLPSQVETGFTLGFAAGEKYSLNVFDSKKNILGLYVNKYSLYPGAFTNLGTATLKKLTTNDVVKFDQTVPLFSYGIFLMLGFNNINVGYNIGFDQPLNSAANDWVYKGKLWQGITVGLDILK